MANNDLIGIAVTGSSETLETFFGKHNFAVKNHKVFVFPAFEHVHIDGINFYSLVLQNIDWNHDRQTYCELLCKTANEYKLSYYVCRFNSKTKKIIQLSNEDQPFFDHNVKRLFNIRHTVQFEDYCYQTFKDWMLANFDRTQLTDLCNNGAACGFSGITYYSETTALYDKYHDDIWEMLCNDQESMGYKSIPEFIASFRGANNIVNDTHFKNQLIWYAAEKTAFEITQGEYPDDEESDNEADYE